MSLNCHRGAPDASRAGDEGVVVLLLCFAVDDPDEEVLLRLTDSMTKI